MQKITTRRLIPCPHGGKVNFYAFLLNFPATGEQSVRDCGKFILENSKKLAAQKKKAWWKAEIRRAF